MAKTISTAKDLTNQVKATKEGKVRLFSRQTWDLLASHKEGWEELKEDPAEISKKTDSGKEPERTAAKPLKVVTDKEPKKLVGAAKIAADKKALDEAKKTDSGKNADDVAANIASGEEGTGND